MNALILICLTVMMATLSLADENASNSISTLDSDKESRFILFLFSKRAAPNSEQLPSDPVVGIRATAMRLKFDWRPVILHSAGKDLKLNYIIIRLEREDDFDEMRSHFTTLLRIYSSEHPIEILDVQELHVNESSKLTPENSDGNLVVGKSDPKFVVFLVRKYYSFYKKHSEDPISEIRTLANHEGFDWDNVFLFSSGDGIKDFYVILRIADGALIEKKSIEFMLLLMSLVEERSVIMLGHQEIHLATPIKSDN